MQDLGLECRDVESLREHYARTLRAWSRNLAAHRGTVLADVGFQRERVWRLYMASAAVLFDVGENHVELIAPLGPDTGVAKFLAKNGPGLHHVAYQTQDIDRAIATLEQRGVTMIDREARVGIRNSRVAFLHPKSTGKVLTELTEPAHH